MTELCDGRTDQQTDGQTDKNGFIGCCLTKVKHPILHDKAFNIAKNPQYDEYQRGLASMICDFFDKKPLCGTAKNENICNKELAEELHKPIIRKLKERKVQSHFIDYILGTDLADKQLISKFHKGIPFLLSTIDIHGLFIPLKDKKVITIANAFQKSLIASQTKHGQI